MPVRFASRHLQPEANTAFTFRCPHRIAPIAVPREFVTMSVIPEERCGM